MAIQDSKDIRIAELENQIRVLKIVAFRGPRDYEKVVNSIPSGYVCPWNENDSAPTGWRKLSREENLKMNTTFTEKDGLVWPMYWYIVKE